MPFKIDIQTNINERDLNLETCSQVIDMLQESYNNMRKEMYNHFLGIHYLKKALIFVCLLAGFYIVSDEILFVYAMPIFVLVALAFAIASAEYFTTQVRKQINKQIAHLKKKKEDLLQKSKMTF